MGVKKSKVDGRETQDEREWERPGCSKEPKQSEVEMGNFQPKRKGDPNSARVPVGAGAWLRPLTPDPWDPLGEVFGRRKIGRRNTLADSAPQWIRAAFWTGFKVAWLALRPTGNPERMALFASAFVDKDIREARFDGGVSDVG
ncbi:hypothetical protein NUU61_004110 [Penicillium alfredii]|uniref:Uncharacterized protein n=1 Tax=Penicillium alfredii TaxID=1506179 RepID=A0A9W9FKH8_9EURO|nr:uncharacterized protein NUU61_004110 [Penicillium alfredii]KAJ5101888.1 hypothetical protein NUU61_004110 [Penicillium alfredii]